MERHPAIRQWITERRRELARNRIAQSLRRSAEREELRSADAEAVRPAPSARKPHVHGAS